MHTNGFLRGYMGKEAARGDQLIKMLRRVGRDDAATFYEVSQTLGDNPGALGKALSEGKRKAIRSEAPDAILKALDRGNGPETLARSMDTKELNRLRKLNPAQIMGERNDDSLKEFSRLLMS